MNPSHDAPFQSYSQLKSGTSPVIMEFKSYQVKILCIHFPEIAYNHLQNAIRKLNALR